MPIKWFMSYKKKFTIKLTGFLQLRAIRKIGNIFRTFMENRIKLELHL